MRDEIIMDDHWRLRHYLNYDYIICLRNFQLTLMINIYTLITVDIRPFHIVFDFFYAIRPFDIVFDFCCYQPIKCSHCLHPVCARRVRGLVKLKKSKKSEKNSDWPDTTYPPPYPFLLNMYNNKREHKKTKKNPKKKFRVGVWPTHPLPSFSRILRFF